MLFSFLGSFCSSWLISRIPRKILANICNMVILLCNLMLVVTAVYLEDLVPDYFNIDKETKIAVAYIV